MSIWRQFLRVKDKEEEHRVILQEHEDSPPKDREFIVFCLAEKTQSNIYPIRKYGKITDTLAINEELSYIKWVGRAKWNHEREWFEIETSSREEHNGFICQPELESNMRWAVLPECWKWWQPDYSTT